MNTSRLECSHKTLKEMGLEKQSLEYGSPDVDRLRCWYCHLFLLENQRCLLFINCLTRYPLVRFFVAPQEFRFLSKLLQDSLVDVLREEGVNDDVLFQLYKLFDNPEIAKSKNRSIIGTAVDFEFLINSYLYNPRGNPLPAHDRLLSLKLARTPISALKPFIFPHRALQEELERRFGESGHFKFRG